jgi:RimJ/RimL family protein N-acetyltransferase
VWERIGERVEGDIVVLEPLGPEHEEQLREAAADPDVWRWMTVHGHEPETFARWLEAALQAKEEGREAPFAVIERQTGKPVGSTRYMSLRPEHLGLEVGYTWNAPSAWGGGVNVETKYLLLERAFEELGCIRVEFKTDALNERARGALEALPARFEGIFRSHMLVRDGVRRDSAWYAVTDAEWPEVRANLQRRLSEKN